MKTTIFGLTFCFVLIASTAHAVKHVGGGGGVGGQIVDRAVYQQGTQLDGVELALLLNREMHQEFERLPMLKTLSLFYFVSPHQKSFYLDDRPFSEDCIDHTVLAAPVEPWACQDEASVRIKASFWATASDATKADLLFHELLTAVALRNPQVLSTSNAIAPFFSAVHKTEMLPIEIEREWSKVSGSTLLPTQQELARTTELVRNFAQQICGQRSELDVLTMSAHEANRLNGAGEVPQVVLLTGLADLKMTAHGDFTRLDCEYALKSVPAYIEQVWLEKNGLLALSSR